MRKKMKHLKWLLILTVSLAACGDDDDNDLTVVPALGTFSLKITDAGLEEVLQGEAFFNGSDRFVNSTLRYKLDLNSSGNDPDFIINVLISDDEVEWDIGSYPLARISPVSGVKPPVAEAYFIGSDTYKFVDNTGIVKINEITTEGVQGEFDIQIINDVTGNFASVTGAFYAKN